jgi:hypothetical protein
VPATFILILAGLISAADQAQAAQDRVSGIYSASFFVAEELQPKPLREWSRVRASNTRLKLVFGKLFAAL